ncbi:MAG TPA: glycosyltransferase family 39 protein [Terriglobales bacterium]|nr:glycosyltransferase family 39 protein [Terriglobales bacterium]
MDQRPRTDFFLLLGFCAFFFFWGLAYFGLVGADEPRYAQVAREMLSRHDWITPTLYGKPWLEKPALYYWQAMVVYSIFGVSDWSARLPSVFNATLMVFAVYFFLRRFRSGFHLDGALMTAACAGVIGYARAASMDMALAVCFTMAMLAWYAWYETGQRAHLAGCYFFLALGTLAKGPVAPFLAAIIVLIFAFVQGNLSKAWRSLWIPGIVLFCAIALPWYVAVQIRNPQFFRDFILQHNLERFSSNLYHHIQPFWYYLPVMLLALVPWTVFVIAAAIETIRAWRAEGKALFQSGDALNVFLLIWLIVPVLFFSFSQSKLPGYILPSVPAGTLLLAEYVRRHIADDEQPAAWLKVAHSILAALPVIPALMLQHIVLQHRFPWNRGTLVASGIAVILAVGMALTLASRLGLRALRFVTLVAVVLTVAAILRIGAPALDQTLSARPLARQISRMETTPLPMATFKISRELEYGLAFYRNQVINHYEWGAVPAGEHLLVAPEGSQDDIARIAAARRIIRLGLFSPQHVEYFWISGPGTNPAEHEH